MYPSANQPAATSPSIATLPSTAPSAAPDLFLFLEIFSREGGIQSYVQDMFRSYLTLDDRPPADVFLLRDSCDTAHPFHGSALQFRYFKTKVAILGRLGFALAVFLYLIRRRPRRVFCGHVNLVPLVWLLCKPLGIPYTVWTHGKEVWTPLPVWSRLAVQQADRLWTVSRYTRERTCAANQIPIDRVQLVPCMVDETRFTPGERSPRLVEQYGLADARVMMTVARLWSGDIYKGVDVTIRALPQIAQAIPTVKYLVIGRGDDQPRLARLAAEQGVADRVVFAGFVPTADLVEHYRLADAYVMPSQEGFGIVYLEAMACGVPVLSGDADGSADPLQDGQLGWRVPHRDPAAVAAACIEILQGKQAMALGNPHDRRCDGHWLREQVIARFGQAALAQQLRQLLS